MRILNIVFKNINSLEGEGRVDFDQGPIADSGVFAITGPNGSGKTSILDVITLGLYGETFRFDKPAEHVITKLTNDSFAQVEFALDGEKFRSTWHVKRPADANKDQVLQPEMSLIRLNDEQELLARTPNTVRTRIAELTGMDFHKFSKSMVLPQGDFAAFLNALDSERMDILEKISGTSIYAEYRQQAEDNFQKSLTRLTQLGKDIELLPLLSPEAVQAAEHDLQDFKDQVVDLKNQQNQLQQQLLTTENINAIEGRQKQLLEQARKVEAQVELLQKDLQTIADTQQATQFREELILLDGKQGQIVQSQATLDAYRQELNALQRQLGEDISNAVPSLDGKSPDEQKQAIDALKLKVSDLKLELPREAELVQTLQLQLAERKLSLAEIDSWLQDHQADAGLLSDFPDVVQLRNLRTELVELAGKQKTQANWTKSTSTTLKKSQTALRDTKSAVAELSERIEVAQKTLLELAQGKSFEELKELLVEQQARVSDFQELHSLAAVNAKFTKKSFFSWFSRNKAPELPDETRLQARLDVLLEERDREENIGKALEQAVLNEALLKKFSGDRGKLVDGKPCYLCGSLQHPYTVKPPIETNSKKALVDQRGKMQALKVAIDGVSSQLAVAKKQGSQLSARQQRLQQMRSQWLVLSNRLNAVSAELDIDNLSLQKRLLDTERQELEKIKNLVNDHAQLQRNVAKWTAEVEAKQVLVEKLTASVEQLDAAWRNRPPEYIESEQQFASRTAEEKALVDKLEKQLALLGEKLPGKGKENIVFDKLNSRRQDYQIRELRQKGLLDEIVSLQDRLQASQAKIVSYQEQMAVGLNRLQGEESLGLHLAILEKQKLIVELERQLATQQLELDAMRRVLTNKIAGGVFADVDSLRSALSLLDRRSEIDQTLEQQKQQSAAIGADLAKVSIDLENELAFAPTKLSQADILTMQRQLSQKVDIAEQEVATLDTKLDKQLAYREKYQSLQALLVEQSTIHVQAEADIKLINDEQGGFRRRIQQLLVDNLLSQANQILEKLSGRYYIRSLASDNGLALEIEDTKQKNLRRLPKTLSGGESFVVSLALALSEIANNGKAIDSLFLDEGFGNLDAEALYLAMSALEGLKTQGKTVGIISHVEAVKKRIKTQVELVKKANGMSELKMVA
ncbi:AAA family ATPase [Methylomonas albis]|uniref:Chromosome segregation protein SMC n=1 Tax=Methylomonas albis TaxID=1854563 RepID=A0ABR9D6B3_9GAMM|nr:SbcC/MukB-like Walker B domain-containing protein [Methylomonas albis]MBD9357759.1 chromosome segregation protein SMC [Methylomonas albis]